MTNGNSEGMSGTPAVSGPVSSGMAGTPATSGPVSTIGGAVATGQGSGPGGNVGGASMVGPEGQTAKAPETPLVLGNDGEPTPVGTQAQQLYALTVAATFNKEAEKPLAALKAQIQREQQQKQNINVQQPVQEGKALSDEQQKIAQLEKQLAEIKKGQLNPQEMDKIFTDPVSPETQNETNAALNEVSEAGQTQSTPQPTPAEIAANAVGVQNAQVQGQGEVQPPQ